jgi:hypothetical protein
MGHTCPLINDAKKNKPNKQVMWNDKWWIKYEHNSDGLAIQSCTEAGFKFKGIKIHKV